MKYQYRTMDLGRSAETDLNVLGEQGWKVIARYMKPGFHLHDTVILMKELNE